MTKEEAKEVFLNRGFTEVDGFNYGSGTVHDPDKWREACAVISDWLKEEDEYIKIPRKALKYRTAGMVAYNAEWLKNHFDVERAAICGTQEPCGDTISRQAVLDMQYRIDDSATLSSRDVVNVDDIEELPSVRPQEPTLDKIRAEIEEHAKINQNLNMDRARALC